VYVQSEVEHMEAAILRSHLPAHDKSALLDKLALGSLIGIGNLAEKLFIHRTKSMFNG